MTLPPPEPKRLPRFKRAPSEVAPALTQRDLEILKVVKDFRLISSGHIQALADGSNQGILRRLQKLFHAGFLDRLIPRIRRNGGSSKMVYAITNQGVRWLQKEGLIEEATSTDWNSANRTLHDFSVAHTLLVSHIRTIVTLACRRRPGTRLLFWREGRAIEDRIAVALPNEYRTLPVAPDAFFGLQDAKGRVYFFLEADRGTMTLKRFGLKLKAYAAYWNTKRHRHKFGIQNFRVLTVTKSAARCANLVASAAQDVMLHRLERLFLFTAEARLSLAEPEDFWRAIWAIPGRSEPRSLFEEDCGRDVQDGNLVSGTLPPQ